MTPSKGISFRVNWGGVPRLLAWPACEKGSVLYEFAMVVLVLSAMLVGIVYGGITFYDYETLANATAVGARTIAINGKTTTQACYLGEQALLGAATSLNQSQITVSFPGTTTTGTYGAGSLSCTLTEGNTVAIMATYPCDMYFPKLGINLCNDQSTPPTITAQAAVRVE
jgi:Flp pilus assembly protein TadG